MPRQSVFGHFPRRASGKINNKIICMNSIMNSIKEPPNGGSFMKWDRKFETMRSLSSHNGSNYSNLVHPAGIEPTTFSVGG